MDESRTLPLPADPALAAMAAALRDVGHWAEIVDRDWRLVYATDDLRRIYGGLTELAPVALGDHYFGAESMRTRLGWTSGPNTLELVHELFAVFGGLVLGQVATRGRTEVIALGDEVNESARIEACATGGRALASKVLLERLGTDDAIALGLDPDGLTYTALADLPTATEKARRDAPAIAVCDV